MTEEEKKQLLLTDLCARLPYGVKAYVKNWSKLDRKYYEGVYTVKSAHPSLNNILACSDKFCVEVLVGYDDYVIKPYLLPLSSMTEEQRKEYHNLCIEEEREQREFGEWVTRVYYHNTIESIDLLNAHHFDYRGLIPMGLALDATGLNIY